MGRCGMAGAAGGCIRLVGLLSGLFAIPAVGYELGEEPLDGKLEAVDASERPYDDAKEAA